MSLDGPRGAAVQKHPLGEIKPWTAWSTLVAPGEYEIGLDNEDVLVRAEELYLRSVAVPPNTPEGPVRFVVDLKYVFESSVEAIRAFGWVGASVYIGSTSVLTIKAPGPIALEGFVKRPVK